MSANDETRLPQDDNQGKVQDGEGSIAPQSGGGLQGDASLYQQSSPMPILDRYGVSPAWFAVLVLIAVFVLYQVVGGLLTFLAFGMKPSPHQIAGFRVATGIGQIVFILVPTLIFVRFASLAPTNYMRIKAPDGRLLGLPLIGIFSLQQVLQIFMALQDRIPLPNSVEKIIEPLKDMMEETYKMLVGATSVPELIGVLVIVALIPAVCEEFLFRGLVQRSFERVFGGWKGVMLTGAIFGAYHLNPFSFIPLAVLGMYLGFLTMRSGSIWISVLAHFFNNAVATVALYLNFNEDAIATGDPTKMGWMEMTSSFILFGGIFALSTYLFLRLTAPPVPSADSVSFPTSSGTSA